MANFPDSLRGPKLGSFKESAKETWAEDGSEVGATRRRNRFTRALRRFSYDMQCTDAQRAALLTFYDETLSRGVSSFTWRHCFDGVQYTVRFIGRPEFTHVTGNLWETSIELEEI